ncbi:MAG: hypothetical protein IIB19_08125 [Chloroflexi bacterium]|nr:hypothetical protein [Chloroflexota bacterium]
MRQVNEMMIAQELKEFVDTADECGSDLPETRALLADWDRAYQAADPWQKQFTGEGKIAALESDAEQCECWRCR